MAGGVDSLLSLPSDIAAAVGEVLGSFSLGSVVPKMANVVAPAEQFVKKFVGQITQLLGPFQRMTDLASHFVDYFDPALVADLGRHFRDLNAVIGVVLRPIVDVARDVVKSLSSYLLPAMRQLEPLVREMANAVGDQLMAGFRDLGAFLHALMPTFREGKDLFVGLVTILGDFRPLIEALGSVFMQLMRELVMAIGGTGSMKEMMADLRRAVQGVIASLVQFAASLMQAFGWTRGIDAMRRALTERANVPQENAGGMAVLLNPMFKSISEMGRSMQQSMFAASAAGGKPKKTPQEETNDFLGKLLEAVKLGTTETNKTADWIKEKWPKVEKAIERLPEQLKKLEEFYDRNKDLVPKFFDDMSAMRGVATRAFNAGKVEVANLQPGRRHFFDRIALGIMGER